MPAIRQLFKRADIEIAVVKEVLERRHPACQKAAILADAVAAHRRGADRQIQGQKLERLAFGLCHAHATGAHALQQTTAAVLALIPIVHQRQHRLALVNRKFWTVGDHVEIAVGNHGCYFNDVVLIGFEPGHFQVDPDQMIFIGQATRSC